MIEPESLTGEMVRELRDAHKITRVDFAALCGFTTPSRVATIENKNSFRGDDREVVARVLNELGTPIKRVSGKQRVDALEEALKASGHSIKSADDEPISSVMTDAPDDSEDIDGMFWYDEEDDLPTVTVDPDDDMIHPSQVDVPNGWSRFGTHAGDDRIPLLDFSDEQDEAGMPLYERPRLKLLSNSEITTWHRCRRKWWLSWYRALALGALDYTNARSTGNRIHRALAAWYVPEGMDRTDPRDALERVIVEDWTALMHEAGELTDEELQMLSTKFNEANDLERVIIDGYMQWIEEEAKDSDLVIVAPETVLQADLDVDVDGVKYPVKLIAKLDVRAQRVSDGARVFIDHKSAKDLTTPRKTLHMNPQMLHYFLLEFLNSKDGEQRCDTALYNLLRKVKRTAQAKPPFFDRIPIHHNDFEIEAYKRRALGSARDIIRAEEALNNGGDPFEIVYPTVLEGRCEWDCDFFKVCPLFDDGASYAEEMIAAQYRRVDPLERYEGKII